MLATVCEVSVEDAVEPAVIASAKAAAASGVVVDPPAVVDAASLAVVDAELLPVPAAPVSVGVEEAELAVPVDVVAGSVVPVAEEPPVSALELPVAGVTPGSEVGSEPVAGVPVVPADDCACSWINSAKNVVVVVVDCELPVEGPAVLGEDASCALLSSAQSSVPLLLPSTLANDELA